MKTKINLWFFVVVFGLYFYSCNDKGSINYESSSHWATEGGYKILEFPKGELTQETAWELVKKEVLNNEISEVNVYASQSIMTPNMRYTEGREVVYTPDYDSWMFFIDDVPLADWHHPCRYVFVKHDGSRIDVIKATWLITELYELMTFISPSKWFQNIKSRAYNWTYNGNMDLIPTTEVASDCYAIIISGGYNALNNHYRYWNHCSGLYNVLTKKYGYPKGNIKSFISDGYSPDIDRNCYDYYTSSSTDLDLDGVDDVTGAATKANIANAFADLRSKLTEKDQLLIFITSHGSYYEDEGYYTTLWLEYLYADELKAMLTGFQTNNIQIVNTTCHSGGSIPSLILSNRVISSSCQANENAKAFPSLEYSKFAYHWINAMLGKKMDDLSITIDADSNTDSKISFYEAFEYAKTFADSDSEHAQYSSIPEDLGTSVSLEASYHIIGNTHFTNQETYSIYNLPSTASVSWNVTTYAKDPNNPANRVTTTSSSTNNTLTLTSPNAPRYYIIQATVTHNGQQENLIKYVTCGNPSPYTGTMSWECFPLTGNISFTHCSGGIEFNLNQEHSFIVNNFIDFGGNVFEDLEIEYILTPDLDSDICNGNEALLTFGFSGEGEMEVALSNDYSNDANFETFNIPYVVFDPNSYSLQLNKSNSTLNITSQATTYDLRIENSIRTVEIRTYDRQTLLTFNLEDEQTNITNIDISSLPSGTYILKITDDSVHYLKLVI